MEGASGSTENVAVVVSQIAELKIAARELSAALKGIDAPVSYTHLRAHETVLDLVCRLLLEKKKKHKTATQP